MNALQILRGKQICKIVPVIEGCRKNVLGKPTEMKTQMKQRGDTGFFGTQSPGGGFIGSPSQSATVTSISVLQEITQKLCMMPWRWQRNLGSWRLWFHQSEAKWLHLTWPLLILQHALCGNHLETGVTDKLVRTKGPFCITRQGGGG